MRSLLLCLVVALHAPVRVHAEDERPSTSPARAERAPRAETTRGRPRAPMTDIGVADAAFTGVLSGSILLASYLPYPKYETPQWRGGILFDDDARHALQLTTPSDRQLASMMSDVLVSTLVLSPVFVDALLMAWLVRGDPELMGRMLLIDLQAHAFAQGLTTLFKHRGRSRAPGGARVPRGSAAPQHGSALRRAPRPRHGPRELLQRHASLAFTSAALICLHHTELGLFGPEGDAATCATGMALASTVGLLRVLADRHYATDVILGAGVGILSGWLVPWLLHYDVADAIGVDDASATLAPMIDGEMIGAQLFGTF
ncbi:MAG: phosphatase PAP2 family protein [Sandaracinaceae bacterium]|nr:phosphatase PAP2 family protein [Sandaracinaceae bacterium]